MTTQLEAQRALAAVLDVEIESVGGTVPVGSAVTLLWQRSWLAAGESVLRHEYKAFGFNARGKYVEMLLEDKHLREIVYMNRLFS